MAFQTFTGKEYLKIDIANSYGLDKKSWNERLTWFDNNSHHLLDLIKEAKEPAMYFAGINAFKAAERGEASGYPISLDATASGFQILAVLTGDRSAAELCNVVDTGDREDAYTVIYEMMVRALGESSVISRERTKDAILTALYGSTAVPKDVFGTGTLLNVFYDVMKTVAPAAWELNETYLSIWNPEAYSYSLVMPDNFHAKWKVMGKVKETVHFLNEPFDVFTEVNMPTEGGRSLGANSTHTFDGMIVREMVRRCDYDPAVIIRCINAMDNCHIIEEPKEDKDSRMVQTLWDHYKKTGYLSARILDHIQVHNAMLVDHKDIWELIDSLPEKPFQILTVHD
ncbi:MAG: DNA-directed RNA polymerase [Sphaerochaetaceae bacterium]